MQYTSGMKVLIIYFMCQRQHIPGQIIAYSNLTEEAIIEGTVIIIIRVKVMEKRFWWWDSNPEHVDNF